VGTRDFLRGLVKREQSHQAELRTSTKFEHIGVAGPLISGMFDRVSNIPGWFNVDDCMHFHLVLQMQTALGIAGDLFEIGSYHGRSTAIMALHLTPRERIVVCDAFQAPSEDHYAQPPSPENLLANLSRVNPDLDRSQVVIHSCLSTDLSLPTEERFRFIHVDGGHSAEVAYSDMKLSAGHLMPKGVLVLDDYHNPQWPNVTAGVDRFLAETRDFDILGDLNRHGALGRKLYLIKR
jgi:predicted O-methyltransferase YrrM